MRVPLLLACCLCLPACQRATLDEDGVKIVVASPATPTTAAPPARITPQPASVISAPAPGTGRVMAGLSRARAVPDPPFTSTPVATFNEPWR